MNRRERRADAAHLRTIEGGLAGRGGNSAHVRAMDRIYTAVHVAKSHERLTDADLAGLLLRMAAMFAVKEPSADSEQFGCAAEVLFDEEARKAPRPR